MSKYLEFFKLASELGIEAMTIKRSQIDFEKVRDFISGYDNGIVDGYFDSESGLEGISCSGVGLFVDFKK